ncbi:MAG TPA: MazG nucleotide pyrophosphohydrolase domain-containing protein [Ktedonobacterales bacterium]|nr:MazG nucleotide pyrophosphohydrolase domain-containing protein [Ktedonobacterales bacterium]
MPDDPAPDTLTLRQGQAAVDATIHALGGYWPPLANLARLFEECGELARAVNQAYGNKRVKPSESQPAVHEELGDALYVLLVLANSLDVDAAAALDATLAKVRARVPASDAPAGDAPASNDANG